VRLRARSSTAAGYRHAAGAARGTPWRDAGYCVLDLELTGLDPARDEIVAWAAVPIDGGRVVLGGATEGLVRPTRPLPAESVRLHGLRGVDLAEAPHPHAATDAMLAAMTGRVLVAHCAFVERAFLRVALRRRGVRLRRPVLDTELLGWLWLAPSNQAVSRPLALDRLAEWLGLPVHRPHEASGDALTTAQVFVALASLLERRGPETVGTLAAARHRLGVAATPQ
jgi:DNA polymerase-3 subunit epsilon